ncbi:MAG TPA: cysteine hydrolase [Sphingobium sp.]
MSNEGARTNLITGKPVLLVIDVQEGSFVPPPPSWAFLVMPGSEERMRRIRQVIDAARQADVPVIFIQEVHRPNLVDFGRELDGAEPVHCVEGNPMTPVAAEVLGLLPTDHVVRKRRYSAFFGTELSLLLREVRADTLLLTGAFTDVCVHYTFVDGIAEYICRVVEDCVTGSSTPAHQGALAAMEHLQPGAICSSAQTLQAIYDFALDGVAA